MTPELTLTPRSYLMLDRTTKLLGLLAVVAALDGAAGDFSLPLGLLGVALGVATVFVDPPEADGDADAAPDPERSTGG